MKKKNNKTILNRELVDSMMKNRAVRTSITKESHNWFFHFYMSHYVKYETAPFQKEMLMLTEGSDPLIVISAFRGSAKSTIFTLSYPIWAILGKQKKKFVLILSQNQHQVKRHFINLRKELESNKVLAQDLGPFKEDVDEWGVSAISISNYDAKIVAASLEQN
ncbi:MAG: hypothetical protein HYT43_01415, partial [Candidatus Taylorbacteria bacterium]|nr:hypothetical protein [Candidatus Taylorbacteria bacterium]